MPTFNKPECNLCNSSFSAKCRVVFIILVVMKLIFFILYIVLLWKANGGPIHASCHIQWTFGESCRMVQQALVDQIKKWNGPDGCAGGGEKCLYAIVSQTESELKATHTTPKKKYIDDLTFDFTTDGNNCKVKGYSRSETWYAVLDYGTNYCNLNNLITGAALDKVAGYSEVTSDAICTQYSSRNCDVY